MLHVMRSDTVRGTGHVVVVAAALCVCAWSCRGAQPPATPEGGDTAETAPAEPAPDPLGAGGAAAARAGLDWLIEHRDALPPGWAFHCFYHLGRVVEDEDLAATIGAIVDEYAAPTRDVPLPTSLDDPIFLNQRTIGLMVRELLRRKRAGRPYQEPAKKIETLLAGKEHAFWSKATPTQQIIFLFHFDELGIGAELDMETIVDGLRRRAEEGDPARLAAGDQYMLALTHVVLYESRYFGDYVDAAELEFIVSAFRAALRHYYDAPPNDLFLDVQGEILVCLKLLRVPDDELIAAARANLIERQLPDGSWGGPRLSPSRKAHLTYTAVLALWDYPDDFR